MKVKKGTSPNDQVSNRSRSTSSRRLAVALAEKTHGEVQAVLSSSGVGKKKNALGMRVGRK